MNATTKRARNWAFTLNNYTNEEVVSLNESDEYRYIVYGREVGESGTPHLQGVVVYFDPKSMVQVKRILSRAHLEIVRQFDGAVNYCQKDGEVFERGDRPLSRVDKGKKEKERWSDALHAAKKGKFDDIPDDIRFRYYRTCKDIAKDHMVRPDQLEDVCGVWIYGLAGVGKSRKAFGDYPLAYLKPLNKWWDGYQGEDSVIIDDIDPDHACLRKHIKSWCDRYPFIAETKGGGIQIRPKYVIITSQYHPRDIWKDIETQQAVIRRCQIIHME